MLKKVLLLFLIWINVITTTAQITVYEDIFKGGVTGDAFNPWNLPYGGSFDIHIEPGSTIRKAYLFATVYFSPDEQILYFNNSPIVLNEYQAIDNEYLIFGGGSAISLRTLMIDVTHLINATQTNYTVSALNQPSTLVDGIFCEYYLYVTYENASMNMICANTFINNIQPNEIILYNFNNLNAINLINNVGLAINSSHMCDTIQDGSFVKINSINIGLIGGDEEDALVSCSGVNGTFYYQNGILTGLGDDVANNTMSGTDAIANIETYLNSTTSFDLEFEYQSDFRTRSNPIHQLFLTYTTPCAPFEVSVSNDTTVCVGSQIQLLASGGERYQWQPATGLSCTTCPNPIVTADKSMLYTVKIRNNDSCSVVRPVKINVFPSPDFTSVNSLMSECGSSTGSISASTTTAVTDFFAITENADTLVSSSNNTSHASIANLTAGNYTIYYVDTFGCTSSDTSITIEMINSTSSSFTVDPSTGMAPLNITIENTSQFATNYEWFVNDNSIGNNPPTLFDSANTYTIGLVAWQFDPQCADTSWVTVTVYDQITVRIPNIFTPNNDGVNEYFTVHANLQMEASITILNRWGSIIYQWKGTLQEGENNLWNGKSNRKTVSNGVYFYRIELDDQKSNTISQTGFIQVLSE